MARVISQLVLTIQTLATSAGLYHKSGAYNSGADFDLRGAENNALESTSLSAKLCGAMAEL